MYCRLPTAGLVLCFGLVSAAAHTGDKAVPFTLEDQYGNAHTVEPDTGRIHVLIFADREGSHQLEDWIRPLHAQYGEQIALVGIASLRGAPAVLRPVLRALFRRSSPQPVLLDWCGTVSQTYAATAHQASVYLIDSRGHIRHRVSGPAHAAALDRCLEKIGALLE